MPKKKWVISYDIPPLSRLSKHWCPNDWSQGIFIFGKSKLKAIHWTQYKHIDLVISRARTYSTLTHNWETFTMSMWNILFIVGDSDCYLIFIPEAGAVGAIYFDDESWHAEFIGIWIGYYMKNSHAWKILHTMMLTIVLEEQDGFNDDRDKFSICSSFRYTLVCDCEVQCKFCSACPLPILGFWVAPQKNKFIQNLGT